MTAPRGAATARPGAATRPSSSPRPRPRPGRFAPRSIAGALRGAAMTMAMMVAMAGAAAIAPIGTASGQQAPEAPSSPPFAPGRQVTVFAIRATPAEPNQPGTGAIDPKLIPIEGELRRLLPNHGFQLIQAQSRRLNPGESVLCRIDPTLAAKADLLNPLGADGKVLLRLNLVGPEGEVRFGAGVSVPPNQLVFVDRLFPDGSRLLIGLGAR